MLLQIVLPFEILAANFADERQRIVRPFVYHQIVALVEPPLAVLADIFAFRAHLPAELAAAHVVLDLHYREHFALCFIFSTRRRIFAIFCVKSATDLHETELAKTSISSRRRISSYLSGLVRMVR